VNQKINKMYTITKEFNFSASHALEDLEPGHPCMRVHGHNYKVTIELKSQSLNDDGFVCDYRKFEPIKQLLDKGFDHKHLNDFLDFQPSAENIAQHLFDLIAPHFPLLSAVIVSETDKTFARYDKS